MYLCIFAFFTIGRSSAVLPLTQKEKLFQLIKKDFLKKYTYFHQIRNMYVPTCWIWFYIKLRVSWTLDLFGEREMYLCIFAFFTIGRLSAVLPLTQKEKLVQLIKNDFLKKYTYLYPQNQENVCTYLRSLILHKIEVFLDTGTEAGHTGADFTHDAR